MLKYGVLGKDSRVCLEMEPEVNENLDNKGIGMGIFSTLTARVAVLTLQWENVYFEKSTFMDNKIHNFW